MSVDREVRPGTFPEFDPDDRSSNPSGNRPFRDVLAARVSRRDVLRGGTVVAAASFLGAAGVLGEAGQAVAAPSTTSGRRRPLLGFTPVPTSSADAVTVPDGYVAQVLIPWGTPIRSSGPAWRKDASNSAAEQARQIGCTTTACTSSPSGTAGRATDAACWCSTTSTPTGPSCIPTATPS